MAVSENDVGEERELKALFRRTAGEDLEVDPYELRKILDSNFKHGQSLSSTLLAFVVYKQLFFSSRQLRRCRRPT